MKMKNRKKNLINIATVWLGLLTILMLNTLIDLLRQIDGSVKITLLGLFAINQEEAIITMNLLKFIVIMIVILLVLLSFKDD